MEEFILRIGANASALKSELTRVTSWAKAWGTTLAEDFKGKIGRMFAAGYVFDKGVEFARETLEGVRERILAIRRAQGELPGVGSAFIQNTFNYLERIGLNFEAASKPLMRFKALLDAAKANPAGDELRSLERLNIVTSAADLKTQSYAQSLAKLSQAYLESGKNIAIVRDLIGKEALDPALLAILERGPAGIESMNRFNPLSDFSQNAVNLGSALFGAQSTWDQVIKASVANLYTYATETLARVHGLGPLVEELETLGKIKDMESDNIAQIEQSIKQDQDRVDIQTRLIELKEKERELVGEIADRGKTSVEQMANEARKMTGIQAPRLFSLSRRMQAALQIDTLEKRATIAFEMGNDSLQAQLMAQAQALRAATPGLMQKDQDPLRHANTELSVIRQQLEPVKRMADQVNRDSK